jgi:hypothetical protein
VSSSVSYTYQVNRRTTKRDEPRLTLSIAACALKLLHRHVTVNEACEWHASGLGHGDVSSTPLLKLLLAHLGLASNKRPREAARHLKGVIQCGGCWITRRRLWLYDK